MKLKITKERFNQIVQEEHQRIQEEKEEAEIQYHQGFPLEPGESKEDFQKTALRKAAGLKKRRREQGKRMASAGRTPIRRDLEEEEHADPVGAGIEDISADDVLGNQPGLGFDLGSQAAFGELFARYDGGKDTAQMGQDFEKIAQIDPELSDVFKSLILRNPLLFPGQTSRSVDLMRNDPEAVDAALAAIPDEVPEGPPESEEDMDSLVRDIQRLMRQQGNL